MWWLIAVYIAAALLITWLFGRFIEAGRGKDED